MNSQTVQTTEERRGYRQSTWFHLLVIMLLCIVIYFLFFASLGWITNHGSDAKVPALVNKDIKAAMNTLSALGFDVVVDSTYEPGQKPFLVLRQSPDAGEVVKKGRVIFITVNKKVPPMTPMPNLLNLSYRSAIVILKNSRLTLGDTIYRPDIAKGAILEMLLGRVPLRPGQMVPEGSKISLVIGDGLGNTEMNVPDVMGMTYPEAASLLSGSGIQYLLVTEGGIDDTSSAIVVRQDPKALNEAGLLVRIHEGDFIDLYIRQEASTDYVDSVRNAGRVYPDEPDDGNTKDSF